MARIKIDLPENFSFTTSFAIRITDLNYGNHVGNDRVLTFLHEARVRFLNSLDYSEFNLQGVSLIMSDAALIFKTEMYYGDELQISIRPAEFNRVGFDLFYKVEKKAGGKWITAASAKTAMVCYNYELKKIVALPESVRIKLSR